MSFFTDRPPPECAVYTASTANSNLRALLEGRRSLDSLGPPRSASLPQHLATGQASRTVSQSSSNLSTTRSNDSISSMSSMRSGQKIDSIVKQQVALFSGDHANRQLGSSDIAFGGSAASEYRARKETRSSPQPEPLQNLPNNLQSQFPRSYLSNHPSVSSKTSWTSSDAAAESAYICDDQTRSTRSSDSNTPTTVTAISRAPFSARSLSPRKSKPTSSRGRDRIRPLSESLQILQSVMPAYEALIDFKAGDEIAPSCRSLVKENTRPTTAAPLMQGLDVKRRVTASKSVSDMLAHFEGAASQRTLPLTGTIKPVERSERRSSFEIEPSSLKRNSAPTQSRISGSYNRPETQASRQPQQHPRTRSTPPSHDTGRYDELMSRLKQRSSGHLSSRRSGRSSSNGSVILA